MNCIPSKIKAKHYQIPSATQKYEQRIKAVKNSNKHKTSVSKLVKEDPPLFNNETLEEQIDKWIKKRHEIDAWRRNVGEAMLNVHVSPTNSSDDLSKNSTLIDSSTLTTTSTLKSAGELKKKIIGTNHNSVPIAEEISQPITPTREQPIVTSNRYCLLPKSPSIPIFTTKSDNNNNNNAKTSFCNTTNNTEQFRKTNQYWNPIKSFKTPYILRKDEYEEYDDDDVFESDVPNESSANIKNYQIHKKSYDLDSIYPIQLNNLTNFDNRNNYKNNSHVKNTNVTNIHYQKLTPQPIKRNLDFYFNNSNRDNNNNHHNHIKNNNHNDNKNYNLTNNDNDFNHNDISSINNPYNNNEFQIYRQGSLNDKHIMSKKPSNDKKFKMYQAVINNSIDQAATMYESNSQYRGEQNYPEMNASTISKRSIHRSESNVRLVLRNNQNNFNSNPIIPTKQFHNQNYANNPALVYPSYANNGHNNHHNNINNNTANNNIYNSKINNNHNFQMNKQKYSVIIPHKTKPYVAQPDPTPFRISSSFHNLQNDKFYRNNNNINMIIPNNDNSNITRINYQNVYKISPTKSPSFAIPKVGMNDTLSMRFSFGSEPALYNNNDNTQNSTVGIGIDLNYQVKQTNPNNLSNQIQCRNIKLNQKDVIKRSSLYN